jgi:hypothetical protein
MRTEPFDCSSCFDTLLFIIRFLLDQWVARTFILVLACHLGLLLVFDEPPDAILRSDALIFLDPLILILSTLSPRPDPILEALHFSQRFLV